MNDKPDNPPAFPLGVPHMTEYQPEWGMSLRDWFAGQIAAAAVSGTINKGELNEKAIARDSYKFADALLAEREKDSKP